MTRDFGQQPARDLAFRTRGFVVEDIGRIADHRQHALIANAAEFGGGGRNADHRFVVQFPVAGVENPAMRRLDDQCVALGNRVRQRHIAYAKRPNLEAFKIVDDVQLDLIDNARFLQLGGDQFGGEGRRIQRHAQIGGEIGHRADMILMRVGQHDAQQVLLAFLDELQIGENQFGAGVFVGAKGHAQIDHQPLASGAIEVDVHANFRRSAQRAEQQFIARRNIHGVFLLGCGRGFTLTTSLVIAAHAITAWPASKAKPSSVKSAST